MSARPNPLSKLPGIDSLLEHASELVRDYGHGLAGRALRQVVERERQRLLRGVGEAPNPDRIVAEATRLLDMARRGRPRRVINATGVVLHTNLGRAPLSPASIEAIAEAAGACTLEYDLVTGRRSSRGATVDQLVAEATGAEAGMAVNNAAAALVLTLAALAHDRPVAVSRGELIEIGGSFRLPDIMAASGARLVEVGTTNRTRAEDYDVAGVALLLKVHPSNYRIDGFAEAPSVHELAEVASRRGVPLVHDVGSGLLEDEPWLRDEPSMAGTLRAGAHLAICSGDKLLGGPQAGLIAGRTDLVAACRQHPLARAMRLDKLRIAGLVATLDTHLRGARRDLPTWAMLEADTEGLRARADRLAEAAGGEVGEGVSLVGGGSAPGAGIPGPVVRVATTQPDESAGRLRQGDPPIIVRVEDGALWLDPRTIDPPDDELVAARVRAALEPPR